MFRETRDRTLSGVSRRCVRAATALLVALPLLAAPATEAGPVGPNGTAYLIPDQSGQAVSFSLDHLGGLSLGSDLNVDLVGSTNALPFNSSVSASGIDLMLDTAGLTSGQWRFDFALGGVDLGGLNLAVTVAGDANLDGEVDAIDLGRLGLNFGSGALWSEGDFNGDGRVDVIDLGRIGQNFGRSVELDPVLIEPGDQDPVAHAPMPAAMSAGLALLGLTAIGRWRRRRYA